MDTDECVACKFFYSRLTHSMNEILISTLLRSLCVYILQLMSRQWDSLIRLLFWCSFRWYSMTFLVWVLSTTLPNEHSLKQHIHKRSDMSQVSCSYVEIYFVRWKIVIFETENIFTVAFSHSAELSTNSNSNHIHPLCLYSKRFSSLYCCYLCSVICIIYILYWCWYLWWELCSFLCAVSADCAWLSKKFIKKNNSISKSEVK